MQPLKVTLLHPMGAPFVVQAARAFADAGSLRRFGTSLVDSPDSLIQKTLCRVASLFGYDLARQIRRRAINDIPGKLLLPHPWRESIRLIAGRLDRSGVLSDRVWEWAETGFDRWMSCHALHGATAVYGYEHACRSSLEAGRDQGLFCIYDVPAPEHEFTHRILSRELDRFPELLSPYQKHVRRPEIHRRRTERRRREWAAADMVVAASQVTRRSFAGYDDPASPEKGLEKVCVIPYGAPPTDDTGLDGGSKSEGPLRFLWAGTFSIRKGAHYFMDAWKRLRLAPQLAQVDIYGAANLPPALLAQVPDAFKFHGSIPRDELYDVYKRSDAFVFPTLCDGFGMVVTEAFSRGLPVITTPMAGAADLVRPRQNGLIVLAADADALAGALQWCLDNRPALRDMRAEALTTAARWQWSDYRAGLLAAVQKRFAERRS